MTTDLMGIPQTNTYFFNILLKILGSNDLNPELTLTKPLLVWGIPKTFF